MTNFPYNNFNSNPYELHRLVLDRISSKSTILDVGCATGAFASQMISKGCQVYGLELVPQAAQKASKVLTQVKVVDLEHMKTVPFKQKFDFITIMEVIEHLRSSENLLKVLKKSLKPKGKIIISTPNIAYINPRLSHLKGKFEYTEIGILDKTHVHFYTKQSLLQLIQDCGLVVQNIEVTCVLRNVHIIGKWLNLLPKSWQHWISNKYDTLLGYQFVLTCSNG